MNHTIQLHQHKYNMYISILSGPCGRVVVDGSWMQIHSGFDLPAAETKSHFSVHNGYGYVRMKIRERVCRRLRLPLEGLTPEPSSSTMCILL
ncbi:hypothetical protein YC2023_101736 [Brassica napus]